MRHTPRIACRAVGVVLAYGVGAGPGEEQESFEMFEWIVMVAVLGLIASRLTPAHFEKARSDWGLKRRHVAACGEAPAPRPLPALAIAGTERAGHDAHGFVKGFGLDPASLKDLRVFRADSLGGLPEATAAMLAELHRAGRARGSDIMELIHFGRPLGGDQAVYFALVQPGAAAEPQVVAFVDRIR
jgi:hypothetical protein